MRTRRRPTRNERGFTTITWMILGLPLIIGLMGTAIDFYRVVQLRQNLDHRANLALVDASNEWAPSTRGGAVVDPARVSNVVTTTYNNITAPWRSTTSPAALACANVAIQRVTGGPTSPAGPCVGYLYIDGLTANTEDFLEVFCDDVEAPPKVELRLKETLNTTFLHVLGIPTLVVPVNADALIRAGNC